jgi:glycosyl transferase, family 25
MSLANFIEQENVGVWLINLQRDTQRLASMHEQLTSLGLPYQRFEAVDGKARLDQLLTRVDVQAYERNMGSRVLPGKMGCYASHVEVWALLAQSHYDVALILEDDVVFHDDFANSLSIAIRAKQHWDTIRFNCIRAKLPISQGQLGPYKLNAYAGPFTGNAAYLVHRTVAQRILPNLWPQTRAFDHELNRFFHHEFRQMGLEPFSSHVDDGNVSSITGVGFSSRTKLKWFQRLPHYSLKIANYFRRFAWLLKRDMCLPKQKCLLD